MDCPFPGMDPYIEAWGLWDDFHVNVVAELQRTIAPLLPDGYAVRGGERYYLDVCQPEDVDPLWRARAQSDVAIVEADSAARPSEPGQVALEAPFVIEAAIEEDLREHFLEIRELRTGRIVTTIEVLSPANKRLGHGRRQYAARRDAAMWGGRNFVEIDLLRGGQRFPLARPYPDGTYFVSVARMANPGRWHIWPVRLQDPLPTIPVPLWRGDPDLPVDLSPLVAAIYKRSNYGLSIDYSLPLFPPLSPADEAWVHDLLRGRRTSSRSGMPSDADERSQDP